MKILDYNFVLEEKLRRRKAIPELESDVHGHCLHVGKISYGCLGCFAKGFISGGIQIGNNCMSNCPMCYYDRNRNDNNIENEVAKMLGDFYELASHPRKLPLSYSYQSAGETLLYIDELKKFSEIFKKIEREKEIEIYHHLYTNGILANKKNLEQLKEMEVDEIRFHLSASDFSKKVIENMYEAAKMNFIVTVEEPAWPLYKDKLMNHLPIFEDIGVKHLDIVEVQVTEFNKPEIKKYYGNDEKIGIYKDYFWHLWDGGMVYDIIEEVIKNKYSYSVIDCNSGVERCRQAPFHYVHDSIEFYDNAFDEYYGFDNKVNNKHFTPIIDA